MIESVFISDLHLHPEEPAIKQRFDDFIEWIKIKAPSNLFILGDLLYAWVGDDAIDDWSKAIAQQIYSLKNHGIKVYYLHGNRDFLIGKTFSKLCGWELLKEPAFIVLGGEKVLLMHGDSYCTKDIAHQRFRKLTRNWWFPLIFLRLPLSYRKELVNKIRLRSMNNTISMEQMDVVADSVTTHMRQANTKVLIHGHTHLCGLTVYQDKGLELKRYVLSDWDDRPQFLCYDCTKGLLFVSI